MEIDYSANKVLRGEDRVSSLLSWKGLLQGEVVGCDFSEAKLRNCVLFKTKVKSNSAPGSRYQNVRFVRCDITDNTFVGATFEDCTFENCILTFNSFARATFSRTEFINCEFGMNGLIDLEFKDLIGYPLEHSIDSKGNPLIYSKSENRINHIIFAGTPQDCIKHLWDNEKRYTRKYVEELVGTIKRLTGVKTGKESLKDLTARTLQDILNLLEGKPYWMSRAHDFRLTDNGIEWLGIYEETLKEIQPRLSSDWDVVERKRNPSNGFLRVDIIRKEGVGSL